MNIQSMVRVIGLLLISALLGVGAAQAQEPEHGHSVAGISIYFGCIPSEIISGQYGPGSSEHQMHGGVPNGAHYHHVMVALFDDATGQRIIDAKIIARISMPTDPTIIPDEKALEPMVVSGAPAFGQYFKMPGKGTYQIKLTINIPNRAVITTTFTHEHE